MDKLPFSVYDFFGYLSAGFVLLVGLAAAFANTQSWQQTPSVVVGLVLIVSAYVMGQVVANLSGYLIEGILVREVLGTPSQVLFQSSKPRWAKVLPGYYRSLPRVQQDRVLRRAEAAGVQGTGDPLFFHCFGVVKEREAVMIRLNAFLNLYGFCRNMSLASLGVAVALLAGLVLGTAQTGDVAGPGWWALGAAIASVGLLYRYLKFFRQYGVEVFLSYAETPEARS